MPNAHREQLYGSPKATTQPYRLRSADGVFWSHMTRLYYRFSLVWVGHARPRMTDAGGSRVWGHRANWGAALTGASRQKRPAGMTEPTSDI
jgi:hypothetical protein